MMDLLTTRGNADPQTIACARLLTSVITAAVLDASEPLRDDELAARENRHWAARSALSFLFGERSTLPLYAHLIGTSAAAIRANLLRVDNAKVAGFTRERRAALQARRAFMG